MLIRLTKKVLIKLWKYHDFQEITMFSKYLQVLQVIISNQALYFCFMCMISLGLDPSDFTFLLRKNFLYSRN